jgi:CHAT domain-containing protein/Tfp pilus assembly protein PilF
MFLRDRQSCRWIAAILIAAGLAIASPAGEISELRQLLGRGQYADAETQAREQLAALSRSGEAETQRAAELLDVLVVAMWRGGKSSQDEAVSFAERAIAIKQRILGPEAPALATSLDNAGVLFFVRGDYDNARQHYQRALSIFAHAAASESRYETDLGKVHSHLGPLYQELGQYSAAREHYEQALRAFGKAVPRDDTQLAMTRNNLATLMVKIGDYDEALTLYREALAALEAKLGAEHPLIASGKHNLAEVHQRLGRETQAIELYRQSAALKEKALGASHPGLALTLSNLSYLHTDRREIPQAQELAARAMQIQESTLGNSHVDLAYGLISLGRAQAAAGDAGAYKTLARALELRSSVLGAENPLLVPPLYFLGGALLAGGKPREAFDHALRADAIGREHLRLTTRGSPERQAVRYAAERLPGLDLVVSIAAQLRDPEITRKAWDALIRSRAVVLDEMAARHRLATRESSAPLRSAFDAYRIAAEKLSNVLLRGPATNVDQYRRTVAGLRADQETAERALATGSETVRRGLAQQQIGFEEVRASLPAKSTLLAFARTRTTAQRAAEYIAFVMEDPRPPRVVSLGSAQDIETAIRRWRHQMTPQTAVARRAPDIQTGEQLRKLVWDPLQLKSNERLVLIVPAGAMHLVNFAALPSAGGRYLAESEVLFHYLSSERDVIGGGGPQDNRQILVVGGASDGARRRSQDDLPSVCQPVTAADFPALPASLHEAQRIASLARDGKTAAGLVTELLGSDATETAFKQQVRGKNLVHVAAHGFFMSSQCVLDPTGMANPLRLSGLVFAMEPGKGDDGILLAEEVATLDFNDAQWVVLSGCDTGIGQIQVDEGVLGLRRAFRIAGADTLVMSLWPVEDQSAESFMTSLYAARLQGRLSTAAAMRHAYRVALAETRRKHGHSHALYWAPFIASGDWR